MARWGTISPDAMMPKNVARIREGGGGRHEYAVHRAHAVDGVEEDRPRARVDDHRDLHLVADPEEQDRDGDRRGRGHRPQQLDERLEESMERPPHPEAEAGAHGE